MPVKTTRVNQAASTESKEIFSVLKKYILEDGFKFTIDLEKCHGCYVYDSLNNREILDLFSFFATNALGHNHPKLVSDASLKKNMLLAALENPTNSDFYTKQYSDFLKTFGRLAMPKPFEHAFFISGGTLAVENALKVAMDWKVKKNFKKGYKKEKGQQVIHFKQAFHGRSGYTMSLTNSKPVQTDYYAKFDWPRIDNPKIEFPLTEASLAKVIAKEEKAVKQIKKAIKNNKDDICAIIIEPIQSEGGDNHFRAEFLQQLRTIADKHELMLIFDEVQNGVGLTGQFWAYQNFNVIPDILVFGKKMQTCGIIATGRVDEIRDNCFSTPGRINSTWGGNLADMVRATKILQIIEEDRLVENARTQGRYFLSRLVELSQKRKISNARGRGLQCAFDLPSEKQRDELVKTALKNNLLLLSAGERPIRVRPALIIEKKHIDKAVAILDKTLGEMGL
jgi:L-lysine 6-transaminase